LGITDGGSERSVAVCRCMLELGEEESSCELYWQHAQLLIMVAHQIDVDCHITMPGLVMV
jgi:hypothetical protein